MTDHREQQSQALQGSLKAVTQIEGKGDPKIGIEEFMSVAERFGFTPEALARLRAAISVDDLGSGPFLANYYAPLDETRVQAFERVARETFGTTYAIGASSGTGALHAAFVAAGVGPGTEVICPAIGFYATAAAVAMANGVPVFCDVDASLSMDPGRIEALITDRTVALAPTCVMGSVPDMDPIVSVARRHGLKVVEDCAQTCGGRYRGRYVGTLGDIGCFSISAYKIVGGGEGGLILMNDERLHDRALCLAEGGGLWRPDRFAPPRYEGELFVGTNYRMSELEAAVDVVQLGKMPAVAERFRGVKRRILAELNTYREIVPQRLNDADGEVGYNLRFFPETIELGEKIVESLRAQNIGAGMRPARLAHLPLHVPPHRPHRRHRSQLLLQLRALPQAGRRAHLRPRRLPSGRRPVRPGHHHRAEPVVHRPGLPQRGPGRRPRPGPALQCRCRRHAMALRDQTRPAR
jgi:8-amino-3,8-dideoxy-alpha-D-manno-octulosonate transaminase